MAGDHGDRAQEKSINLPGQAGQICLTPVPAFPAVVIEPAVTEVASVLSVEPVAIVLIIHAIAIVAAPCGIIIVVITWIIPF